LDHSNEWTNVERLRSRFGVEIPLASLAQAWQPRTLYAVANVEPMYRYDRDDIDPARAQVGVGYIVNHRIRTEFLHYANWGRPNPDDGLRFTQNIWRLNVKVGLSHALLGPRLGSSRAVVNHGRYIVDSTLRRTLSGRRRLARFIAYAFVATLVATATEIFLMSRNGG